ncbi:MAG: VOC family protein [Actinomycetota bacterium]|nr:VOC family protein [Actinomycetota bacterium]
MREHLAGFRSHTTLLAGAAAFAVVTVLALGPGPHTLGVLLIIGALVFAACFHALRLLFRRRSGRPELSLSGWAAPPDERRLLESRGVEASTAQPRRLALGGLHHVTLIVKDVRRSVDFYRNVLGLRLVKQTVNEDDRSARHLFFGDEQGRPGTMITCLEYPQLDEGTVGVGSTHHVAFSVGSDEELEGWRAYLESRGVQCTELLDRTYFRSVYLRDPDGHILELATAGPGMTVDEPLEQLGQRAVG